MATESGSRVYQDFFSGGENHKWEWEVGSNMGYHNQLKRYY